MNRRLFLGKGFAATAALAAGFVSAQENPRVVRCGVIGTGGRGTSLLQTLLLFPHIEVPAVCDLVRERADQAAGFVEKPSATAGVRRLRKNAMSATQRNSSRSRLAAGLGRVSILALSVSVSVPLPLPGAWAAQPDRRTNEVGPAWTVVVAHRGDHTAAHENSLDAVRRAIHEAGLTLINHTAGTLSAADYTGESDTNFVSSRAILESILTREELSGLNGWVLLFHLGAGPSRTDKFHPHLGGLIDELSRRGSSQGPRTVLSRRARTLCHRRRRARWLTLERAR